MEIQNTMDSVSSPVVKNKIENISFIVLLITLFLSPLVFINTNYSPIDSIKMMVITFGVLISTILYAISLFKKKTFSFSKSSILTASLLLVLSTIISALLSTSIYKSFIGQGFELGTVSSMLIMFLAMFLTSMLVYENKERLLSIYGSVFVSFIILCIFHILRLISPTILSFGIFNYTTSTLIGRWSDLGIFAAVVFLLSFFALKLLSVKKSYKVILSISFLLSGLLVFLVNIGLIWAILAVIFLGYGIYNYIKTQGNGSGFGKVMSKVSLFTLIVLIISSVLAWKNESIATPLLKSFNLDQQIEISLPWQLTLDVTADTLKAKPLFGAGPNRFGSEFLIYKPLVLNSTNFWNTEFNTGFGFIPSVVVNQGSVGGILWILFFVFFFTLGIKGLKRVEDVLSKFFLVSTFFVSSFLWFISIFYSPSHFIVLLTFIMTGLFLSCLAFEKIANVKEYNFETSPFARKMLTLVLILTIVLGSLWSLVYVKKAIALSNFRAGLTILNDSKNQELDKAEASFKKALSWDKSDIYYQVISELDIMRITAIAQTLQEQNQKDPKSVDQELVKKVNQLLAEAASSTMNAINLDPTNYYNYIASARVYELASSFEVPNAYENAQNSYKGALMYNPYNPSLYLSLARLEASKEKMDEAQQYIGAALQLKQNYTEAIFFLSQIQVNQGKIKDAIISTQVTTQINPTNPMLFFQLGFLYYNDKDYENAVTALKKAIELNPQYANARYFLGLSYARLSKNVEAIEQFEEIAKTNPENQEVASILKNLKAGKSPFTDVKPPADSKPEKRSTLPVKEKTTTVKPKVTN